MTPFPVELLNVVDVEATCWEGAAPPGQISEILEIGLAVVDLAKGERVGRHRIVVRPTRSTVSPFCTELTGLTQAEVDGGVTFAAARHGRGVAQSPAFRLRAATTAARTTPGTSPRSS